MRQARLLLVDFDELHVLWDAIVRHRLSLDIGDPDFVTTVALADRIGELMSDEQHRLKEVSRGL